MENKCTPKRNINEIINSYKDKPSDLIKCLQEVQDELGYIPEVIAKIISKVLTVPESEIYSVITFYSQFSLRKKAEHSVEICLGTACYVLGASKILETLESELGIKLGEQTTDARYEIVQSRCLGCCSMAPVIKIDGNLHGHLTAEKTKQLIKDIK